MTLRKLYILLFSCIVSFNAMGHGEWLLHGEDIVAVLGFDRNTKIFNRSKDTNNNHSWVKFISTDMIDKTDFHKQLESEYPGLSISGPNRHRLLFHWAFEAEPWNNELQLLFIAYCENANRNKETNIRILKSKLVSEQKRRNKKILNKTREVFQFESGKTEGHVYTPFFAAMAYNIHILGDYMSDNTELKGLCNFDELIGKIVIGLRNLDNNNSKQIINGITQINKKQIDVQKKADLLMDYLKKEVPYFIQTACNGSLKRKIEGQGYKFTKLT